MLEFLSAKNPIQILLLDNDLVAESLQNLEITRTFLSYFYRLVSRKRVLDGLCSTNCSDFSFE